MSTPAFRVLVAAVLASTLLGACSGTATSPAGQPSGPASVAPSVDLPTGFPLGSWTTTITEDDLRAGGLSGEGELAENAGKFTLVMSEDGTWNSWQVADVPLRWPVFRGTWSVTRPDGFQQVTTFPTDYAGDIVEFTWARDGDALRLHVVNTPDPILPVIMETHPWQPAG